MLNRAEFTFGEVLVPWVLIVGVLGFFAAWRAKAKSENFWAEHPAFA
jgi:hypothetical protein